MRVRAARLEDLDSIRAIEDDVFPPPRYPPFFFRQALDLWPRRLLVAEGARLEGYALAAPGDAEITILSVAVRPSARGAGVGRALVEAILAADPDAIHRLTVRPGSPAARLYARLGFEVVAEDPAYFGEGEPRRIMRRQP